MYIPQVVTPYFFSKFERLREYSQGQVYFLQFPPGSLNPIPLPYLVNSG